MRLSLRGFLAKTPHITKASIHWSKGLINPCFSYNFHSKQNLVQTRLLFTQLKISTLQQRFICIHLLQEYLTFRLAFSSVLHHKCHTSVAAWSGLVPPPELIIRCFIKVAIKYCINKIATLLSPYCEMCFVAQLDLLIYAFGIICTLEAGI